MYPRDTSVSLHVSESAIKEKIKELNNQQLLFNILAQVVISAQIKVFSVKYKQKQIMCRSKLLTLCV